VTGVVYRESGPLAKVISRNEQWVKLGGRVLRSVGGPPSVALERRAPAVVLAPSELVARDRQLRWWPLGGWRFMKYLVRPTTRCVNVMEERGEREVRGSRRLAQGECRAGLQTGTAGFGHPDAQPRLSA
jgi:hypothetical protein